MSHCSTSLVAASGRTPLLAALLGVRARWQPAVLSTSASSPRHHDVVVAPSCVLQLFSAQHRPSSRLCIRRTRWRRQLSPDPPVLCCLNALTCEPCAATTQLRRVLRELASTRRSASARPRLLPVRTMGRSNLVVGVDPSLRTAVVTLFIRRRLPRLTGSSLNFNC